MRPLAKAVTKTLERVRSHLREQVSSRSLICGCLCLWYMYVCVHLFKYVFLWGRFSVYSCLCVCDPSMVCCKWGSTWKSVERSIQRNGICGKERICERENGFVKLLSATAFPTFVYSKLFGLTPISLWSADPQYTHLPLKMKKLDWKQKRGWK